MSGRSPRAGSGVVPLQAAVAFSILIEEAGLNSVAQEAFAER